MEPDGPQPPPHPPRRTPDGGITPQFRHPPRFLISRLAFSRPLSLSQAPSADISVVSKRWVLGDGKETGTAGRGDGEKGRRRSWWVPRTPGGDRGESRRWHYALRLLIFFVSMQFAIAHFRTSHSPAPNLSPLLKRHVIVGGRDVYARSLGNLPKLADAEPCGEPAGTPRNAPIAELTLNFASSRVFPISRLAFPSFSPLPPSPAPHPPSFPTPSPIPPLPVPNVSVVLKRWVLGVSQK